MTGFLTMPWFARGRLLRRARETASVLARHGLGWLVTQVGLSSLIPFERGRLGHPARETPYTQAEHLRMAFGELGATFIKLGQAHVGTLKDGQPIIVKVQWPGVTEQVERDLEILSGMAE